jgi:SAM-dependent methyltransferase
MSFASAPAWPTSPAADRNKGPILELLRRLLPGDARVLEVASGSGQHAEHCAAACPGWRWQPSEAEAALLPAIAARCARLSNVAAPIRLNLLDLPLAPDELAALGRQDALFAANLLHISPWPVCAALMRLAAALLAAGGRLVVYGPFEVEGEPLAPSNAAFDAALRASDARWGLRRLGEVQAQAAQAGLDFEQRVAMPANNLVLVWRKPG